MRCAEAIVRAQARAVAVCVEGQCVQRVAGEARVAGDAIGEGIGAFARNGLAQRDVVAPKITRGEFRRLVVGGHETTIPQ